MKFNIIKLPKVSSTNSYAQHQIESNSSHEGDVIFTLNQQVGRGQGKNIWESETGSNLNISIILQPKMIHASQQFVLTQLVSLAIIQLLSEYINDNEHEIKIKWPNDIYVGDNKIAGILFQNFIKGNEIEYSIVGIGINVNQLKFLSLAPNPISIIHHTNKQTDIGSLLNNLLENIAANYKKYATESTFPKLKSKYINNLYQYDIWANYSDSVGKFKGKIIDIDEFGRLIVKMENDHEKLYMFKEIEFLQSNKQ
ncbi:MAG: biotin--[acetyl-CoA-carboxylase] ligase [Bacteroidota bacterium]